MERLTSKQRELVEQHVALVDRIVSRLMEHYPSHTDRDDVVQAGMLGLIDASRRFDGERGASFATFAARRIEGSILDQLRRNDWAPRSVRAKQRQLQRIEDEGGTRLGTTSADVDTLSEALGVPVDDLRRWRADIEAAKVTSINCPAAGASDNDLTVGDTLCDPKQLSVEAQLDECEFRGFLRDALRHLPERHRLVIVGHFFQGRPLMEISEFLGVSQGRVSQIKEDAFRLIRQAVQDQYSESPPDPSERTPRVRAYSESVRQATTWKNRLQPADVPLV